MQVCRYLPGRAIVVLMLMRYVDGDLGQYYEYGTNVMVNPPGSNASGPRALQSAGAFIHHLPVDQAFTLEAGTDDLGLPEGDGRLHGSRRDVSSGSTSASTASSWSAWNSAPALPIPSTFTSRTQVHPSYSYRDGVTARNRGEMTLTGVRYRPAAHAFGSANTLRQRTGIAWLAETRAGLEFG